MKAAKYSVFIIIVLMIAALTPTADYLLSLPASSALKPGAKLSEVFPNFAALKDASISLNPTTPLLECMSCVGHPDNDECRKQKAAYIARSLLSPGSGMLSWHLRNASFSFALRAKYDDEARNKVYFALVSSITKKDDIDQVCETRTAKPCYEMSISELNSMFNFFKYGSEINSGSGLGKAERICFAKASAD